MNPVISEPRGHSCTLCCIVVLKEFWTLLPEETCFIAQTLNFLLNFLFLLAIYSPHTNVIYQFRSGEGKEKSSDHIRDKLEGVKEPGSWNGSMAPDT